jgi:hypothetical protein
VSGGLLGLALARPWGRRTSVPLERTALAADGLLMPYGGVLVAVGAVALTGALGEPADRNALRWHVLLWDPWFLLWGLLLVVAALSRRRLSRGSPSG